MRSFTFIHTSDWHLGREFHDFSMEEDQAHILRQVLDHVTASQADALVIAGDVYDRSIPSEWAVRLWSAFVSDLRRSAPGCALVAISGNHDNPGRLGVYNDLLDMMDIHLGVDPLMSGRPLALTGRGGLAVHFHLLPFLPWGTFAPDVTENTQEAMTAEAIRRIHENGRSGASHRVLVGHCYTAGGAPSDSERTLIGGGSLIDPALFDSFDYVALGHLHRPQRVDDRIVYSGSPLAYSLGEHRDVKSMRLVTLREGAAPDIAELAMPPLRPVAVLEGTMEEILERAAGDWACHRGSYVEARVTDAPGQVDMIGRLREYYPRVVKITDASISGPALSGSPADAGDRTGRTIAQDFNIFWESCTGLAPDGDTARLFDGLVRKAEVVR